MSIFSFGLGLARRRPQLALAWSLVLIVPACVAMIPFDIALGNLIDLRPAATHLVTAPTNDALWPAVFHSSRALVSTGVGSFLVAFLLGIPLLWIVSGFVTLAARGEHQPPGYVASRAIAVALASVPLRVVVWALTAVLAASTKSAMTEPALQSALTRTFVFYALASSFIAVVTDYARAFAFADPGVNLLDAWLRAFRFVAKGLGTTLALTAFELVTATLALAPIALTRPLGFYSLVTGLLALAMLGLRAAGGVVSVAAATDAASRSA